MPELETIKRPLPTKVTAQTEAGPVETHYDRNAVTGAIQNAIYSMPIRERLSRLLVGWDVTMNGECWQPESLENIGHWQGVIRAQREQAHVAWTALKSQRAALTPEAALALPPLGDEPIAPDAPMTVQDRRAAYSAAWRAILDELPNDFVKAIDDEVLDDFLGGRWRMNATGRGLPQASTATGSGPGSLSTPVAA